MALDIVNITENRELAETLSKVINVNLGDCKYFVSSSEQNKIRIFGLVKDDNYLRILKTAINSFDDIPLNISIVDNLSYIAASEKEHLKDMIHTLEKSKNEDPKESAKILSAKKKFFDETSMMNSILFEGPGMLSRGRAILNGEYDQAPYILIESLLAETLDRSPSGRFINEDYRRFASTTPMGTIESFIMENLKRAVRKSFARSLSPDRKCVDEMKEYIPKLMDEFTRLMSKDEKGRNSKESFYSASILLSHALLDNVPGYEEFNEKEVISRVYNSDIINNKTKRRIPEIQSLMKRIKFPVKGNSMYRFNLNLLKLYRSF